MTPAGDGYDEDERRDLAAAALRSGGVLFAVIGIALAAFFAGLAWLFGNGGCDDCAYLSGSGRHPSFDPRSYGLDLAGDRPYTCRAEISSYQNAHGETPAAGAASIEVFRSEQVILTNRRYAWRSKTIAVVIETDVAAASGEVIFDPREGLGSFAGTATGRFSLSAWVDVPEPSAEWSVSCEPYEAP